MPDSLPRMNEGAKGNSPDTASDASGHRIWFMIETEANF